MTDTRGNRMEAGLHQKWPRFAMDTVQSVDCLNLTAGALLDIETKTRHYRIEYVGGSKIWISGHPEYCPEPTAGWLEGSIDPEGAVGLGLIEPGKRMLFRVGDGRPVTTSKVLQVRFERPPSNGNLQ
jgi:hypothetical protein